MAAMLLLLIVGKYLIYLLTAIGLTPGGSNIVHNNFLPWCCLPFVHVVF